MNKSFRSAVCTNAFNIQVATGRSFGMNNSNAMRQAWRIYRLKKAMHTGEVSFNYIKADGSIRTATGTLVGVEQFIKGTGKEKSSVAYFDVEKKAFRSFRPELLVN